MATQRKTGTSKKITPIAVERYLKGIGFPAKKQELIKQARKNKAPEAVTALLDKLDEQCYNSPADVAKEVGDLHKLVCGTRGH